MKEVALPVGFQNKNKKLVDSYVSTSLFVNHEKEKHSYLMFLVRLLFRYLRGNPTNEVLSDVNNNVKKHLQDLKKIKVEILIFLEKLMSNLEENMVCQFSLILVPVCIE